MPSQKKIGIIPGIYCSPVFQGLSERYDLFELITDTPAQVSKMLREEILDAAFLSPISYARDHDKYSIISNICVSSKGFSNTIQLYFKEDLKHINTIATDLVNISEMVLTKIIMSEKYSTVPQFIPATGGVDNLLGKADAVLKIGDENIPLIDRQGKLDLVDEWFDLTELPYVHGFWVSRKEILTEEEINVIHKAAVSGQSNLNQIAKNQNKYDQTQIIEYLSAFSYQFDDESKNGLTEFIRMAYYLNIIDDLPELNFHTNSDNIQSN